MGVNTGSPTSREAHGDGAIVVVRARESLVHGEGWQVTPRTNVGRYAKCGEPYLPEDSFRNEAEAEKMKSVLLESRMHGNRARTVREGADENVRNATRQPPTLPRVSVYGLPTS
jgi:hypothetical protein